jgi:cytochrome c peroxidase
MHATSRWLVAVVLMLAMALGGCGGGGETKADRSSAPAGPASATVKNMFGQVTAEVASAGNPLTPEKIALGRMLFYDARLSASGTISCNSCHQLDNFGVDGKPVSEGHDGSLGTRNSPTVYNAAGQLAQFWDGREPDVENQAKGPVLNAVEHGMDDGAAVEKVLKGIPGYGPLFAAAFPGQAEPITFDNFALAIGAFERKLTTYGRWDRWLAGDGTAITQQEKAGLDVFVETGCATCHMGTNLGGSLFQKMGLVEAFHTADLGRYEVTQNEAEKNFFKVPGLRNIAQTGPYLHDGSVASLEQVTEIMAKHQLGKTLTPQQIADVTAFLKALTGKIPEEYIAKPELPPSAS